MSPARRRVCGNLRAILKIVAPRISWAEVKQVGDDDDGRNVIYCLIENKSPITIARPNLSACSELHAEHHADTSADAHR